MSNLIRIQDLDLDNLTQEQSLKIQAKMLGYKRMPVDIETFIEDPYYLGNTFGKGKLYRYWKEKLKELYPTPIHVAHRMVILTGPIGGGKTTFTCICTLYLLHKLDCLENYDYFGVQILKGIDVIYFHTSAQNAYQLQVTPTLEIMNQSPYFNSDFQGLYSKYYLQAEGLRNDKSTGHDVLQYNFSEVNFVDYEGAKFRIDQSIQRLKSRFLRVLDYFGNIFIDSSAADEGSLVEDLIKQYPIDLWVIRDPIWVIKESTGNYYHTPDASGSLTFKVFTGDESLDPYIITESKPLHEGADPDKVIEVPNELLDDYRTNTGLALQNTAGIGTVCTNTFIADKDKLRESFTIANHIPEIVLVDFFDTDERLIDIIRAQLKEVPEEKILCIAVDMGVSGDLCGFSASYMDDYVRDDKGNPTSEIKTVTPLVVAISRKPDQETRISKIFDLIIAINEVREVGLVVTDGYQSTQLRQDLTAVGIWCYLSSVDRTKDGYIFYKLQVYKGYQKTVNHVHLRREAENVVDTGYKIDHTSEGCFVGDTKIITESGLRSFEDLLNSHGTKVLSYNEKSGDFEFNDINSVWVSKKVSELIELEFENGTTVRCTIDHKFLTTRGYIEAQYLEESDEIISYGETKSEFHMRIKSKKIIHLDSPVDVFDMEVSNNHNFVLFNGAVAHNSKDTLDSTVNSVWNISLNPSYFMELSKRYTAKVQMKALDQMVTPNDMINDFLRSRTF